MANKGLVYAEILLIVSLGEGSLCYIKGVDLPPQPDSPPGEVSVPAIIFVYAGGVSECLPFPDEAQRAQHFASIANLFTPTGDAPRDRGNKIIPVGLMPRT